LGQRGSVRLDQMPNNSPETLKGLSDHDLFRYVGGWKPGSEKPLRRLVRDQASRKRNRSHGRGDQHPVTRCRHSRAHRFVVGLVGPVSLPGTKGRRKAPGGLKQSDLGQIAPNSFWAVPEQRTVAAICGGPSREQYPSYGAPCRIPDVC
jgi:hypothetical protein